MDIAEMDDLEQGQNPEQGDDFEMVDASEKEAIFVQTTHEEGRAIEKAASLDELDPCVVDCESQTTLVEELESLTVDSKDPSKSLQVYKNSLAIVKERLKNFLCRNLDILLGSKRIWLSAIER